MVNRIGGFARRWFSFSSCWNATATKCGWIKWFEVKRPHNLRLCVVVVCLRWHRNVGNCPKCPIRWAIIDGRSSHSHRCALLSVASAYLECEHFGRWSNEMDANVVRNWNRHTKWLESHRGHCGRCGPIRRVELVPELVGHPYVSDWTVNGLWQRRSVHFGLIAMQIGPQLRHCNDSVSMVDKERCY